MQDPTERGSERLARVRGVCLDLDGVLYVEERVVPGAPEAVDGLRAAGLPIRFLTNTTMRSRRALVEKLRAMRIPADESEVLAAPAAAAEALRAAGVRRISALVAPDVLEEFAEFEITDASPEAVVVGDMGDHWTPAILNGALRHLAAGARLVALCKARTWRRDTGIVMDAGPYVAALEFAARVEASVIGKPAASFFRAAVASMRCVPSEAVMIGDDPESDVAAAMAIGMCGVLVLSGKVNEESLDRIGVIPHAIFPSVAEAAAAIRAARV